MTGTASASLAITHPVGLHARPAVKLTKLAKTFPGAVRLRHPPDGAWVDAKSLVKVMALKLRTGAAVEIEAEGEGAEDAVRSLSELIERDFDEHG